MSEYVILTLDSPQVQYLYNRCSRLSKVIDLIGPISYSLHDEDPYSFMVHEIIEQMLSVKAGAKIYGRLEELCNGLVIPEKIDSLTDEQLRSTGTSNAKVEYIRNITKASQSGILKTERMKKMSDAEVIKELTGIRGIGNWTAKMFLMFVLGREDILPIEDGAFLQVYRWMFNTKKCDPTSVCKKCKHWKPYSTLASRYCYRALDAGLTKKPLIL